MSPSSSEDLPSAALYPMRVVTRMTGLTADTIRAWERRYQAVEPGRTLGNTRKYSAEDVRRLTLLRDTTQRGHSISSVASLSSPELQSLIDREDPQLLGAHAHPGTKPNQSGRTDALLQAYLGAISRFEARRAADLLARASTMLEPRDFVFDVVLPLLREVGIRYSHSDLGIAEEHLVSEQLRGTLSSLARLSVHDGDRPRVLVTTPAGHRHSFGALVAALLLLSRGFEPIHLGPDLPDQDLAWAVKVSRCKLVILSVAQDVSAIELARLSVSLKSLAQDADVWLGSPPGHSLVAAIPSIRHFHSFEEFDLALAARKHGV